MNALTEASLRQDVWPQFSMALARPGIYLANHSLGRPPDRAAADVAEFMRLWYEDMDRAWDAWLAAGHRFTQMVERVIGAAAGTVTQRASAGQGLRAVLNSFPATRPVRVVTTEGEFDSIDTVLRAYAEAGRADVRFVPLDRTASAPRVDPGAVLQAARAGVDLVVVSHVLFGSGAVFPDLGGFVGSCRELGALTLVDLYHSAGTIPLDVDAIGMDFAIGGSYKYLRGGPGAGWLYVAPTVLRAGRTTVDTGWFAKADTFEYRRDDGLRRKPGIEGWAESTPAVIATYQALAGAEVVLELGIDRLRAYSLEQQAVLRAALRRVGAPVMEPSEPAEWGAFSLVRTSDAAAACARAAAGGLTVDARGEFIRLCPDILNPAAGLEAAAEILRRCL